MYLNMSESGVRKVITRFPPSPTGHLHIGRARTALFNYLFAKHEGGEFLFRLEDTDKERSKPEFAEEFIESLTWLGIKPDNEEVLKQSERKDVYKTHLKKLIDDGHAYISKESSGDREEVIRFKNPNKKIMFTDLIRGDITFDTTELKDFVIAKSLDEPIYHLAVVVDDMEMGITHVIRGEDGISNTPRQILIQEALGAPQPNYAHIPLILAEDRSKLSGRKGATSIQDYREQGYKPEVLLNYLALLGWNPGSEQEIFSLEELIRKFDISKVQKGGAVFNEEKLRWMSKEYLTKDGGPRLVSENLPKELSEGRGAEQLETLSEMILERIHTLGDITRDLEKGEFDYLVGPPTYPKERLTWKKAKSSPKSHLEKVSTLLQGISSDTFSKDSVKDALMSYAESEGKGDVLWPMRVALSGREKSPDPFTLAAILGKEETIKRIKAAAEQL